MINQADYNQIIELQNNIEKLKQENNELSQKITNIFSNEFRCEKLTLTYNMTNLTAVGAGDYCYRYGPLIIYSCNIKIKTLGNNAEYVTFPYKPIYKTAVALTSEQNHSARCLIPAETGALTTDGVPAAVYYNGSVVFLTSDPW